MDTKEQFRVTIFGKEYIVEALSYSRARTIAARIYNGELEKEGELTYPLSFLTSSTKCEKVNPKPKGRPSEFGEFYKQVVEVGSDSGDS